MTRRPEALIVMDGATFAGQFDEARLARLAALASTAEPLWTDTLDTPEVRDRLAEVEVLITGWGVPRLTADRLEAMPKLRALLHCAGSVRGFAGPQVWERGVAVSNAAHVNAVPVAEYTLAAILFDGKKAPFLANDARVHREDWAYAGRRGELSNLGRTVGIVGFSKVGRRVVEHLRSFGSLECVVYDPHVPVAEVHAVGARAVGLDELLACSDVVSVHAPALESTRRMFGAAEFAAMREHATFINTARGSLVDTDALASACATGRIHAILDVTDPEPLPAESPLYSLPNVMLTPHIAGSLGSETRRMTDHALDELERWAAGAPLAAPVTAGDLELSA
ncbi:hydroxyacid dehydrogenase [Zhihengliuella halotolerans]|uniref:Phosphoglycerate dehydrogenase-like enzyme n=1 Tax=Zhihengliuella halotolerans TaxID=370736 RepID=A0A4Q8AE91_9MICC|nr:hydroxyacid dehydrogenase [Zhihengliuella halotolerans]RZU62538.1 phosphoglycerate dehydrogenase-like enzyme [Zhihengliuella halotolerans]